MVVCDVEKGRISCGAVLTSGGVGWGGAARPKDIETVRGVEKPRGGAGVSCGAVLPHQSVEDRSRRRGQDRDRDRDRRPRTGTHPGITSILGYRKPSWLSADCNDCWKPALV